MKSSSCARGLLDYWRWTAIRAKWTVVSLFSVVLGKRSLGCHGSTIKRLKFIFTGKNTHVFAEKKKKRVKLIIFSCSSLESNVPEACSCRHVLCNGFPCESWRKGQWTTRALISIPVKLQACLLQCKMIPLVCFFHRTL